jgi:probable F420-dependent oxidoreductase
MRIGLGVSENLSMRDHRHLAERAETAGFASLWTNEARGRDALLVCHAWATATSTIELGTGVVPIWTRSAAQIAMAAATLQEASDGRLLLGLGVSHPATMGAWHGASYRHPLRAARETLDLLDTILSGGMTEADGEVFSSRKFALDIDPMPPRARLYLAAMGPKMLELAGERADGVLLNWSCPEEISRTVGRIRASAARAEVGRRPGEVDIAAYVRIAVDEDRDAARSALGREISTYCALPAYAEHFSRQGFQSGVETVKDAHKQGGAEAAAAAVPERMLRSFGWFGVPHEYPAAIIGRYRASGLQHLVARVVTVGDDPWRSIDAVITAMTHPAGPFNGPGSD